jgi:hypothetical protein
MVDSQTSSLKVLGVPFFGVKPHLVVGSSYDPTEVTDSQPTSVGGKISKEQLLELQRKMLNHLMELYGDWAYLLGAMWASLMAQINSACARVNGVQIPGFKLAFWSLPMSF